MAKFRSKSDLRKSLVDNITLLHNDEESIWVEFHEIEKYLNKGFQIFNEDKKKLYERISKKI